MTPALRGAREIHVCGLQRGILLRDFLATRSSDAADARKIHDAPEVCNQSCL